MRFLLIGIGIIAVLLALLPHIVYLLAKLVGVVAHFRVGYRPFGSCASWALPLQSGYILSVTVFILRASSTCMSI